MENEVCVCVGGGRGGALPGELEANSIFPIIFQMSTEKSISVILGRWSHAFHNGQVQVNCTAAGEKEGIIVYFNLYYMCSTNYSKQKYPLFCLMDTQSVQ